MKNILQLRLLCYEALQICYKILTIPSKESHSSRFRGKEEDWRRSLYSLKTSAMSSKVCGEILGSMHVCLGISSSQVKVPLDIQSTRVQLQSAVLIPVSKPQSQTVSMVTWPEQLDMELPQQEMLKIHSGTFCMCFATLLWLSLIHI